jgi:2-oxoglutarate ferredoxin oxidoreductase subunit delta
MKSDVQNEHTPTPEADTTAGEASGKPHKGKVYLNEAHCKGCSYCVIFCPRGALVMGGRMNRKGYHLPELKHPEKCNGCDTCGLYCPDFAIFGVRLQKKREPDQESNE